MDKNNGINTKSITGFNEGTVATADLQGLISDSILAPFISKLQLGSGITEYPFVDLVDPTATSFIVGGINLTKARSSTAATITNETLEDVNPAVGFKDVVDNILDVQTNRQVQAALIAGLVADATIQGVIAPTWAGIKGAIKGLTGSVFAVPGTIYVGVNLNNYMDIIEDSTYVDAIKSLGTKVNLVVVDQFSDTQVLVLHEHGVAGGLEIKEVEEGSRPALDATEYVSSFNYSFGWDSKYIKFSA